MKFLFFLLIFNLNYLRSEELNAYIDKTYEDGSFLYVIEVLNSKKNAEIEIDKLKDFEVLSNFQSSSVSSKYINGKFTTERKVEYKYRLLPIGEVHKVPSVFIKLGNKNYKTEELNLEFAKKNTRTLFLKVEISKEEIFLGEGVFVKYYLYSNKNITNVEFSYPEFKEAIKKDLENASGSLKFENTVLEGKPYKKALIASYLLFPLKKGALKIASMQIKALSATDDFSFFSNSVILTDKSKELEVLVKDIPASSSSFKGLVGDFTISSKLSTTEIKEGEFLSVLITIKGFGNLESFEDLDFEKNNIKVYDKNSIFQINPDGKMEKVFNYTISFNKKGENKIGPFFTTVFSPTKKEYLKIETSVHNVFVKEGFKYQEKQIDNKGEESYQKKSIRYIKTSFKKQKSKKIFSNPFYYLSFLILIAFYYLVFVKEKKRERRINPINLLKQVKNIKDEETFLKELINSIDLAISIKVKKKGAPSDLLNYIRNEDLKLEIRDFINNINKLKYCQNDDLVDKKTLLASSEIIIKKILKEKI